VDKFFWWVGVIVTLTAVSWIALYATAWLIEDMLKMLRVHWACCRFVWHWKEFRIWYLERNAEPRKKKARRRKENKCEEKFDK